MSNNIYNNIDNSLMSTPSDTYRPVEKLTCSLIDQTLILSDDKDKLHNQVESYPIWQPQGARTNAYETEKMDINDIILLPGQQYALDQIKELLPIKKIILLEGSAGTGKTTLTKCIVKYFHNNLKMKHNICAIAPTHKARRVIENVLNKNTLFHISTFTVASALSKIREHSYIGTKTYNQNNVKKLNMYNLILIDEISMINDIDMKILINFILKTNKLCILIGDSNQIPCPTSQYEVINIDDENKSNGTITRMIQKKNSYIFTDPNIYKIKLTEIVRQSIDSPIIQLAHYIKDNLNNSLLINNLTDYKHMFIKHSEIYQTYKNIYDSSSFINKYLIRVIAYTNLTIKQHNTEIRHILGYTNPFVVGDIMMGYSNMGYPELIIENGQDYVISNIIVVSNWVINSFNSLSGYIIELDIMNQEYLDFIMTNSVYKKEKNANDITEKDEDNKIIKISYKNNIKLSPINVSSCSDAINCPTGRHETVRSDINHNISSQSTGLFFIDIYAQQNYQFIKELIRCALKVNNINSTKKDYLIYKELKDRVVFIEDIYFYNKCIYTETTIKENHPLLFTNLTDLITTKGEKNISALYEKINKLYPGIIDTRLSDDKIISENEMLIDKYKVIEKDMYYGYSITSHKSQGSTYHSVIVDEFDFNKITNKWNYKYNALENRIKEKNQLRYVAYTRAKENLFIVCNDECPLQSTD